MEYCYENFGSHFIWLTDDNFGRANRAGQLADNLLKRGIGDDFMWFIQWRCDDVIRNKDVLPQMRKAGLHWVMMGVESPKQSTLESWKKGLSPNDANTAVKILKENDIFAHAMFVMGARKDTADSIEALRMFVRKIDPDFAIFTALTPFPGTGIYQKAERNGWIEDRNWSHYDMAHAIMPTETLSRKEVQEELYQCYRDFYGSWRRRIGGVFSSNELKRRIYLHMLGQGVLGEFKRLARNLI
jgi:anaerobic magnesium-protoporphyrin IX monomethyl ester cyclase